MLQRMNLMMLVGVITSGFVTSASANTIVPVESDFFTTAWAFGAPFVRDAGRDSIGVSTVDPFLFDGTADQAWEETTYFTFNFNPGDYSGPVASAVLRVETVLRSFGTYPNATEPFAISAQRVLDDPTTIDGSLASGPGSYVDFKNDQIGAVEDTVSLTDAGIFNWDITDLVNEWIANADANFDYSIAMTGRVGNPVDLDGTNGRGAFHAFVNSEGGLGGVTARIIIPEPASLGLLVIASLCMIRRR